MLCVQHWSAAAAWVQGGGGGGGFMHLHVGRALFKIGSVLLHRLDCSISMRCLAWQAVLLGLLVLERGVAASRTLTRSRALEQQPEDAAAEPDASQPSTPPPPPPPPADGQGSSSGGSSTSLSSLPPPECFVSAGAGELLRGTVFA